jgi:hypothetical protein
MSKGQRAFREGDTARQSPIRGGYAHATTCAFNRNPSRKSVWPRPSELGGCRVIRGHWRRRLWLPQRRPAILVDVFSPTTGDRTRATHAHSHPNNPAHRHRLAAKLRALHRQEPATELHRQAPATGLRTREPAPHKLLVVCKPGLHRSAAQYRPVGAPALHIHRQVPPSQRPVLRSRIPESYKPGPMRWPLKVLKRLFRERELYSSPISLVVSGCRVHYIQRRLSKLVRDVQWNPG